MEYDDDLFAVEVAGEVEGEDLEERLPVVEGRPAAEARDARVQLSVRGASLPRRCHGGGGCPRKGGYWRSESRVRGRVRRRNDLTDDRPAPAEEGVRHGTSPAEASRGSRRTTPVRPARHRIDDPQAETEVAAVGREGGGRAAAALAEMEVAADDDAFDLQPVDQDLVHECIGGHRRECRSKGMTSRPSRPTAAAPRLRRDRRQAKHGPSFEDGARMRLEGEHQGRRHRARCRFPRRLKEGRVTEMHAVEIADRHDAPGQAGRGGQERMRNKDARAGRHVGIR